MTGCSAIPTILVALISAGMALIPRMLFSILLALRLRTFRPLAFDLLIDHLHRAGPGGT
jgi:hypothetical protein